MQKLFTKKKPSVLVFGRRWFFFLLCLLLIMGIGRLSIFGQFFDDFILSFIFGIGKYLVVAIALICFGAILMRYQINLRVIKKYLPLVFLSYFLLFFAYSSLFLIVKLSAVHHHWISIVHFQESNKLLLETWWNTTVFRTRHVGGWLTFRGAWMTWIKTTSGVSSVLVMLCSYGSLLLLFGVNVLLMIIFGCWVHFYLRYLKTAHKKTATINNHDQRLMKPYPWSRTTSSRANHPYGQRWFPQLNPQGAHTNANQPSMVVQQKRRELQRRSFLNPFGKNYQPTNSYTASSNTTYTPQFSNIYQNQQIGQIQGRDDLFQFLHQISRKKQKSTLSHANLINHPSVQAT